MSNKSSSPAPRRKALGRGLNALLANKPAPTAVPSAGQAAPVAGPGEAVQSLDPRLVDPNPDQPRTRFDDAGIQELAQSIRTDGVIQPILVRPSGARYLIIAGERRWRAAQVAGLERVPAIIREIEDDKVLEIALIENIQREDLNPIEVAQALLRLGQELELSHEELAQRTGKDRTTVTNLLRLLRLPIEVQQLVAENKIAMGHARAVLALEDEQQRISVAEQVVRKGLSVRAVEQLIKQMLQPAEPKKVKTIDPNVAAAVESLEQALGAPVRLIQRNAKRGRIEIEYSSPEELDRIYTRITGEE